MMSIASRQAFDLVIAAGRCGISAAVVAERLGISANAARQRLVAAREASGGDIVVVGGSTEARWVASHLAAALRLKMDERTRRAQRRAQRRYKEHRRAVAIRQRIVAAGRATPIVVTAPRSVFDYAERLAA